VIVSQSGGYNIDKCDKIGKCVKSCEINFRILYSSSEISCIIEHEPVDSYYRVN
jgi:hypothetical protein